jgi:hypothetical protein
MSPTEKSTDKLPRPGGDVRYVTAPEQASPTRAEFNQVLHQLDELTRQLAAANRELAIQFDRMAQLQADIDLVRVAWVRGEPGSAERSIP